MLSTLNDEHAQNRNQKRSRDEQIHSIFSHPLRSRILELLGTRGPLGFTMLRDETKIGVGTLYYHISVLGDLVVQGRDKRYMLSETGKAAYQMLVKGPKLSFDRQSQQPSWSISPLLSGTLILHAINQSPLYHIPWTLALLFFGAWASSQAGLTPSVLFLLDSNSSQIPAMLAFMLGWLAIFAISAVVATLVFGRKNGSVGFVATSALAYVPIVIFALIWLLGKSLSLGLIQAFDGWLMRMLFFVLQGWSLVLLASALRVSKALTTTESAITVLAIVYLNAAFVIVGGRF
jgi:hypothetical protein